MMGTLVVKGLMDKSRSLFLQKKTPLPSQVFDRVLNTPLINDATILTTLISFTGLGGAAGVSTVVMLL